MGGLSDGVAAAALVFEWTTAGAGGVASHVLGLACRLGGWFGGLRDLVELQVAVEAVELDLGDGSFANGGALRFDEFNDLHGGFESDGCRGQLVTENVSKSVECEVGEAAEFVYEELGAVVAGGEKGAGEVGVLLRPEMDG